MADGEWHEVVQGEWLTNIAVKYNIGKLETIWDHPNNADLKNLRNPDILYPGDLIFVPALEKKQESCDTEAHFCFQVSRLWDTFQVQLLEGTGKPIAGKSYVLKLGSQKFTGTTDANGWVRQDNIDPNVNREATLELPELGLIFGIGLGNLNPGQENSPEETAGYDDGLSGVQMRLANLGYTPGNTGGVMDSVTQSAITMFQTFEMDLPSDQATGTLTDDTRDAIMKQHYS